jgi:putative methyltransferase
VLPSKVDLHAHPLYVSGDIILQVTSSDHSVCMRTLILNQDKASCFPAHVLSPPAGAHVIDGCAAPGNKTSHLASLMGNQGCFWAFDLDARRLQLLERMTNKAGCTIVHPIHGSFLEIDPKEYPQVEYILLDPSCSGSGIVSRLDQLVDQTEQHDNERLENLASFQLACIQHAFRCKLMTGRDMTMN